VDVDADLMEAWSLGMDESGWTDLVMDRAEGLLPAMLKAGYVATEGNTWWFTSAGVARAEAIEAANEAR
jgi:hypothetical protein